MLNGVLVPLLCLSSRRRPDPGFGKRFLPTGWHFLGNWTSLAENKYTCDLFNKWINTVFQIKSKNMGRETERELSSPSLFCLSEAPQQAEARSTKIVFVRRNFSAEFSPATYWVRFGEWIVKVWIWHMVLSKKRGEQLVISRVYFILVNGAAHCQKSF